MKSTHRNRMITVTAPKSGISTWHNFCLFSYTPPKTKKRDAERVFLSVPMTYFIFLPALIFPAGLLVCCRSISFRFIYLFNALTGSNVFRIAAEVISLIGLQIFDAVFSAPHCRIYIFR